MRGVASLFEPTHRVHLVDLPGFGDALPPPADWDTIKYADLVQQYLLARAEGAVVVVGHSFGGRVAIRLASRRLPAIRGIVLMGVPGLPVSPWSSRGLRRTWIRLLRKAFTRVQRLTGPAPMAWHTRRFGSKDYLAAGALRPILVRIVTEDLSESARTVACPALLLWGAEDRETPPELADRYRGLLGGHATVTILPHKDHYPFAGTGAHLCASRLRVWLAAHVEA